MAHNTNDVTPSKSAESASRLREVLNRVYLSVGFNTLVPSLREWTALCWGAEELSWQCCLCRTTLKHSMKSRDIHVKSAVSPCVSGSRKIPKPNMVFLGKTYDVSPYDSQRSHPSMNFRC